MVPSQPGYGHPRQHMAATTEIALNGHAITSVSHAWSLAIEEKLYIVWPFIFLALARGGRRRLIMGLIALVSAILVWRSIAYLWPGAGSAYVYNAFDTRFDSLAMGCLLAVPLGLPHVRRIGQWVSAATRKPFVMIALLLVLRLLTPLTYRYSAGVTIDALLVAVLIVQLLALHHSRTWSWLEHRAAVTVDPPCLPGYSPRLCSVPPAGRST